MTERDDGNESTDEETEKMSKENVTKRKFEEEEVDIPMEDEKDDFDSDFDSDRNTGRISFVKGNVCDSNYLQ